jgi:hypothetical protein
MPWANHCHFVNVRSLWKDASFTQIVKLGLLHVMNVQTDKDTSTVPFSIASWGTKIGMTVYLQIEMEMTPALQSDKRPQGGAPLPLTGRAAAAAQKQAHSQSRFAFIHGHVSRQFLHCPRGDKSVFSLRKGNEQIATELKE